MGTRGRREESICSDHDLFSDSLTNLAWREHVRSSAGTDGLEWRLKPIYLSRWDEDFSASRFPRKEIVICAGVIFIFMAAAFATDITKESDFGFGIHFLTYSGELIASVVSGCFVVLLSLPRSRAWFTRYHEGLTMFWIIMVFVTYLQSLFMSDYRLQLFEVRTELEFSNMTHGKPSAFRRNCTESHYEMTLQSWPYFYEPGCLSTMSGAGGSFGFLIVLFMVAPQFHVSPRKAAIGSVIMGLCYATLGLADGWTGGNFVACLALLIATGGLATILCDTELTKARQEFALSKGIVYASTQKRRLLNTIIPPNVLEHMDQSNKAVPISRVTVLFCRVRLTVEDTATFDLMNSLFLALDGLVKNSGMFKYQHVCTGSEIFYIVGCPRMACPYDDSVQALRYPHKETLVSMIRLAADINKTVNSFGRAGQGSAGIQRNGDKAIATAAHWRRQPVAHHTSPVSSSSEILPISVHMGLCSGPVAGIVLGKCRRFYCVYGDTVNVAARMCQLACPGQMMAPAGLYYQQGEQGVEEGKASRGDLDGESGEEESGESAAGVSGNSVEDEMAKLGFTIRRGWKKVKGKGQMQVDEVIFGSLDQVHRGVGVGCGGGVVGFDAPSGPRQSGDECNAVAGATAGEKEAAHADNKVETGWDRRRRRSSILSEAEVSGAVLESGAMGNLLVQQFKEPRHEVDKRWARFRHPSMELQFVKEQIPLERRVLSCAILWHASFALWQMQMIMMPDIPEYWQTFEVEELERRRRIATAALVINVVIITVTGGALLVMLWYEVICESRRTGGLASWLTCACVRKQGSAACSWSSVLFRGGRSCPVKPRVSSLLQSLEGGQRGSGEGLLPTPGRFKACVYGFMALKILNWVLMGFCANTWLARRGVSVLHSTMALYNFGISYSHMGVSFRLQAAMHAISLVAFIISAAGWLSGLSLFQRVGSQVVPKFSIGLMCIMIGMFTSSLAVSRVMNLEKRRVWLLGTFMRVELRFIENILIDLLPAQYHRDLMHGRAHYRTIAAPAVVLQLDIIEFTQLAASMSAVDLAEMINTLFSAFDDSLAGANVFKVDTIGDAYVVLGWLRHDASDDTTDSRTASGEVDTSDDLNSDCDTEHTEERSAPMHHEHHAAWRPGRPASVCLDMLEIAARMLQAMEELRARTGVDIHCRIGIACGESLGGFLGSLQPRLCISGKVINEVAELEKLGTHDAVHVSGDFIRLLLHDEDDEADPGDVNLKQADDANADAPLPVLPGELDSKWLIRHSKGLPIRKEGWEEEASRRSGVHIDGHGERGGECRQGNAGDERLGTDEVQGLSRCMVREATYSASDEAPGIKVVVDDGQDIASLLPPIRNRAREDSPVRAARYILQLKTL